MSEPERVNWTEEAFLEADSVDMPIHIGGVVVLDGSSVLDGEGAFPLEDFRRLVANRLHRAPRLRQVPTEVPLRRGAPVWTDVESVDIAHHVRMTALPAPGTWAQLYDVIGDSQSRFFSRHRPLWELLVVTGLPDEQVAIVARMHHSLVDGVAAVVLLQLFVDFTPEVVHFDEDTWEVEPVPPGSQLLRDAYIDLVRTRLRTVGSVASGLRSPPPLPQLMQLVNTYARILAPPWSAPMKGRNREARSVATFRGPLDRVKEAAARHEVTVNDLVLAAAAGGIGQILAKEPNVPDEVMVEVPVSLRTEDHASDPSGNYLGHVFPSLPLGVEPFEVLRRVHHQMQSFKAGDLAERFEGVASAVGLFPPTARRLWYKYVMNRQPGPSAIITNVPGPPIPLYVLGGQVVDVYPFVSPTAGMGLSVAVTGYRNSLTALATADRELVPEVDPFIEGFTASMEALTDAG